jgi:hypothetical protein
MTTSIAISEGLPTAKRWIGLRVLEELLQIFPRLHALNHGLKRVDETGEQHKATGSARSLRLSATSLSK